MADKVVRFPQIPKNHYYEHYLSALVALSGRFVERSVVKREKEEILELDVVTTNFSSEKIEKAIIEIKGGKNWGLPDIFKVRGWMDYLKMKSAFFIVQDVTEKNIDFKKRISADLGISLLSNVQTDPKHLDDKEIEEAFGKIEFPARDAALCSLRFAFCMEEMMLGTLLREEREESTKNGFEGYQKLAQYIHVIHNVSFFEADPLNRISKIFQIYAKNKNITAGIIHEDELGYPEATDDLTIPNDVFNSLFYQMRDFSPLYISLHAELLNKLLVLKSSVEYIILKKQDPGKDGLAALLERLRAYILPENLRSGVTELEKKPHYFLYPFFWQIYVYLFGGFVILSKKEEEYSLLSSITGVPVDEIDDALSAFDLLFPMQDVSWHHQPMRHQLSLLKLFPIPLRGIGSNFRRLVYSNDKQRSFEGLKSALRLPSGDYSFDEIVKWNNLACNTLLKDKNLVIEKE